MTRYYCTLFDINFLAKGIALYDSLLQNSSSDWKLFILCLDEKTYELLKKFDLQNAKLIPLKKIEDDELLTAKNNRNATEYCWTLTPSLPLYILNNYSEVDLITYLDADLYFFSSPEQIFKEFGNNSILLIPHNLPPEKKEKEKVVGKYNVGMMIFRRDEQGLACLSWWRQQCNNWCYEIPQDGKLGDQKYLDYFEEKFKNVYVINNPGVNLAGWNIKNFRGMITRIEKNIYVNNFPLIFFHFSSYKLYHPQNVLLPNGPTNAYKYFFPSIEKKLIYKQYYNSLIKIYKKIGKISPNFIAGLIVRPNIIKQIKQIILPLTREYLANKKNSYLNKKKLIILEHNNGRLANQLWNFISIYAYALEKKYKIENYCFNSYSNFFNFPITNHLIKFSFFNKYNKGYHIYRRINLYGLYKTIIKIIYKKNIVFSGDTSSFILPPSTTKNITHMEQVKTLEKSFHKNIYFCGWLFRNPVGIKKYHQEIIEYFKPNNAIVNHVNNLINSLKNYRLKIGVHIRQTDFKTFANGEYYFSPQAVKNILNNFINDNKLKQSEIIFIICSDENIDKNIFSGLNVIFPQGNAIQDLFTLAKTDMIIGTNSTFGPWAAFYGNIPIVFFNHDKMVWPDLNLKEFNFPDGLYRNN